MLPYLRLKLCEMKLEIDFWLFVSVNGKPTRFVIFALISAFSGNGLTTKINTYLNNVQTKHITVVASTGVIVAFTPNPGL